MNPDEFVVLNNSGLPIIGQGELSEFDASAYPAGVAVSAPRWPLLASAPATVVNGQRFRLAGSGFGTEYLGVSGSWVAQANVTFALYQSKRIFHNQGIDYVNWGMPSGLITLLNGDYIMEVVLTPSAYVNVTAVCGLSDGVSHRQFVLAQINDFFNFNYMGGVTASSTVKAIPGGAKKILFDSVSRKLYLDGLSNIIGTKGTETYSGNIYIGGRTDGASVNWEGDTYKITFKNTSGVVVDEIDFSNVSQWDGGMTGTSKSGAPFTFTDGAPTTKAGYNWIPMDLI